MIRYPGTDWRIRYIYGFPALEMPPNGIGSFMRGCKPIKGIKLVAKALEGALIVHAHATKAEDGERLALLVAGPTGFRALLLLDAAAPFAGWYVPPEPDSDPPSMNRAGGQSTMATHDWNHNDPNHPAQYDKLPDDQKQLLRDWIAYAFRPAPAYLYKRTSYGLKHDFQFATDLYVNNGAFKGAMQEAGYTPKSQDAINPAYKIRLRPKPRSRKERLLKRQRERQIGWWATEQGIRAVYDIPGGLARLENIPEPPTGVSEAP